jgi:hypothetical protein
MSEVRRDGDQVVTPSQHSALPLKTRYRHRKLPVLLSAINRARSGGGVGDGFAKFLVGGLAGLMRGWGLVRGGRGKAP